MPVFNNSDNKSFTLLKPGDYIFCVTGFKRGVAATGKSAGATIYELTLSVRNGNEVVEIRDTLYDTQAAGWRIDTFLKCCGIQLNPGQPFEFDEEDAKNNNCAYVDPWGLCGWAKVGNRPDKNDPNKKYNDLQTYYTDRKKVQRAKVKKPDPIPFGDRQVHNEDVPKQQSDFDTW